jgi:hypothetical protein
MYNAGFLTKVSEKYINKLSTSFYLEYRFYLYYQPGSGYGPLINFCELGKELSDSEKAGNIRTTELPFSSQGLYSM